MYVCFYVCVLLGDGVEGSAILVSLEASSTLNFQHILHQDLKISCKVDCHTSFTGNQWVFLLNVFNFCFIWAKFCSDISQSPSPKTTEYLQLFCAIWSIPGRNSAFPTIPLILANKQPNFQNQQHPWEFHLKSAQTSQISNTLVFNRIYQDCPQAWNQATRIVPGPFSAYFQVIWDTE